MSNADAVAMATLIDRKVCEDESFFSNFFSCRRVVEYCVRGLRTSVKMLNLILTYLMPPCCFVYS